MKTIIKLTALLCLVINLGNKANAQKFAIKSGYVEYELTGSTTGIKKIWWDNYGVNSYTETQSVSVVKMFGITSETKEHIINVMKGENFWSANLEEGSGQKGVNPYYQMGKDFAESLSDAEIKQLEKQIMDALNAEKIGTESILGNTCDIFNVMGAKSWIYKGIVLKSDANVMGIHNIETAVKFEKNITVPASKFSPIEGIDYIDLQEAEAMYYGEDSYSDDEDNEAPKVPVNYPYEKFKSTVNNCSIAGYNNRGVSTVDGQHFAIFMQGISSSITIAATSKDNADGEDIPSNLEEFNLDGHKCMYGPLDDDEGTALIVDYPTYNMYIIIAASPNKPKDELIKINKQLKF